MIYDATVEVTCDHCGESVHVGLTAGARNTYLASDSDIESRLRGEGWFVKDGKHYCCEEHLHDANA